MGRKKGEPLSLGPCRDIRAAEGTVVNVDRVVSGERVAVGEEGHVALRLGQVDMQCSVAAGCNGATGKGAKNPLVVSLLNDRLFSPAPVKGGGEEEKKDLKQVKNDSLSVSEAKKKDEAKAKALSFTPASKLIMTLSTVTVAQIIDLNILIYGSAFNICQNTTTDAHL